MSARSRHGSWEAWTLAVAGGAVVLAWGLFGVQGVLWVVMLPVLAVMGWVLGWARPGGGHAWNDEIDSDFDRIRLERRRRQRARTDRADPSR